MTHDELVDAYLDEEFRTAILYKTPPPSPGQPHPFLPYLRGWNASDKPSGGPPCAHLACSASRANPIHHV